MLYKNLTGIRTRTKAVKSQRATHSSWAFYLLRQFIEYKAKLAGIPVILIDPRYTSQICPSCGCIDKKNRPTRNTFACVSCGFSGSADHTAAGNIRVLGGVPVNAPYVSATA